jgi:hypothetical protein
MAITLDGTTGLAGAATGALNGTLGATTPSTVVATSVNTPNTFGFKNRIINGAMVIDQRNAGASVTPTGNAYTLDRWRVEVSQSSKFSVQQNAGSVTPPTGFSKYLGITSLSAYSIGSGDYFVVRQAIEGNNIADLGWGAAGASAVTLSFQVRSSLTGTFGGSIQNADATRSYPFTYTISSANTWTSISVTIAGDTTGTWQTGTSGGIYIYYGLGVGSTYSGTASAWASANYISATSATSVVGTNGATLYITGVQLEKGSTATSFDVRDYGRELMMCQRYYYLLGRTSTYSVLGSVACATTTEAVSTNPSPVTMRTVPSVTTSGSLRINNGSTRAVTSVVINDHATPYIPATNFVASGGGLAAGQGAFLSANNDITAFIAYSAEL